MHAPPDPGVTTLSDEPDRALSRNRDFLVVLAGQGISSVGDAVTFTALPLLVLVNANSASASEIVAGSLAVHGRAKLVGTVTYGKGSVQQDFPLPDGSDLHLTIRHWFLPDGSSVEQKGLTPSVTAKLASPDDMFDASKPDRGHAKDTQLNQALDLLARGAA